MAQRRMFSPKIVASDAFLDMPTSSRELYFQLGMYADDDGFINPKKIVRMIGASEDDLKVLISKRFVIPFESGVVVIKHWAINNLIRKDWHQDTIYTDEKKRLKTKENGAYTEAVNELGNKLLTECSVVKLSVVKARDTNARDSFEEFWKLYPRRIGKKAAWKVWQKLDPESIPIIMHALPNHVASDQWVRDDQKYVPHPTTWLNNERWTDEVEVSKQSAIISYGKK